MGCVQALFNRECLKQVFFERGVVVRNSLLLVVVGVAILTTIAVAAFATDPVTSTWLGGDGDWTDPSMWDTPDYPHNNGTTYNAVIDAGSGPYTVELDTSVSLDSLLLNSADAELLHTRGILNVGGTFYLQAGTYSLKGGTIAGSTITGSENAQLIAWWYSHSSSNKNTLDGVTLGVDMNIRYEGDVYVRNGLTLNDSTIWHGNETSNSLLYIYLDGSQTIGGNGEIVLNAPSQGSSWIGTVDDTAGTVTIGPGITIRTTGVCEGGVSLGGSYTLLNQGTIRGASGGNWMDIGAGTLINESIIEANAGKVRIYSDNFVSTGNLSVSNGGWLVANVTGDLGQLSIGTGSWASLDRNCTIDQALNVPSGSRLYLEGNWNNLGGITATDSTIALGGTPVNMGSISLTNATVEVIDSYTTLQISSLATSEATLCIGENTSIISCDPTLDNTGSVLEIGNGINSWRALELESGTIVGGTIVNSGGPELVTVTRSTELEGVTVQGGMTIQEDALFYMDGGINQGQLFFDGAYYARFENGASNEGTINVNNSTWLALQDNWSNTGTITVSNAELWLEGTPSHWGTINADNSTVKIRNNFTTAEIESISRVATRVSIEENGVLDNSGDELVLNDAEGTWYLKGGTIIGGRIASTGDTQLSQSGTLDGVTLANEAGICAGLTVENGLVLDGGQINLGKYYGYPYSSPDDGGRMCFLGSQTLGGSGKIAFAGYIYGWYGDLNYIYGYDGTLTIGPDVEIYTANGDGKVGYDSDYDNNRYEIINQGSVSARTAERKIKIRGGTFSNYGRLEAINGGSLDINLDTAFVHEGELVIGEGSNVLIQGDFNPAASSSLIIELGELFGVLNVYGNSVLDGELALSLADGFSLEAGDSFEILTAASIAGSFSQIDRSLLPAGTTLDIWYGDTAVTLFVPGLLGDVNGDHLVSADDYVSVQANFGNSGVPGILGDANHDGLVSADDYASVQAHFGDTSGGMSAVPEPATLGLLLIGGMAMLRRKR